MNTYKGFQEDFRLDDRVAIVTGAANGIGEDIARMLARKGAHIIAFDIDGNFETLRSYVTGTCGVKFLGYQGDVSRISEVKKLVAQTEKEFGKIDILVNNAGVGLVDKAEDLSEEMWDKTMNVNLKGPFLVSQLVGRRMIAQQSGKIINIASQAGVVALRRHAAYSPSKAGLIMLTKMLALEWGEYGICVNAVSPTVVLTKMGKAAWDGEVGEQFKKNIPTGRFAYPEEVAACVTFLASDAANMINGENLVIDGGYSIT